MMGMLSGVGKLLKMIQNSKKKKPKKKLDKQSHSFNSNQGRVDDTSTMQTQIRLDASPRQEIESLRRGSIVADRFKKESGYFKKDQRRGKRDRRK